MLNSIRLQDVEKKAETPESLLLGCHDRIRHFTGVAKRLAHAQAADPQEVASAAEGVFRYFSVALPLHEADENLSLHPRLKKFVPEGELAGPAADAMLDQHAAIDELVERLLPIWSLLRANPGKLDDMSAEMCALSSRLDEIFRAHLELEETTIFPAISKYLPPDQRQELVFEMQARRR